MFDKNKEPDQYERESRVEQKKRGREARERKLEEDMRIAVEKDAADRVSAREFNPNVRIVECAAGKFLCYDGVEVPVRFIESIDVSSVGSAPFYGYSGMGGGYVVAGSAVIKITKASGQIAEIKCTRHELDILFDALVSVWKNGEPRNGKR